MLRRGINVTYWFRSPPSRNPVALARYLSDEDIDQIVRVGFTFVRLPIMPNVVQRPDGSLDAAVIEVLIKSIQRLHDHGLGVVIVPFHDRWTLEAKAEDRHLLIKFWQQLAPALQRLNRRLTFPELLNEPVFPDIALWNELERSLLGVVRSSLPDNTVITAGNQWGSIAGLLRLGPIADKNVAYSFHYYDPPTLTSQASWNKSIDHGALARLPFPVNDERTCLTSVPKEAGETERRLAAEYCSQHWTAAMVQSQVSLAAKWGREHGVKVLALEFGIVSQHERQSRLNYLKAFRIACEKDGLGWALWGYDASFGLNAIPSRLPSTPKLDNSVLSALGLNSDGQPPD